MFHWRITVRKPLFSIMHGPQSATGRISERFASMQQPPKPLFLRVAAAKHSARRRFRHVSSVQHAPQRNLPLPPSNSRRHSSTRSTGILPMISFLLSVAEHSACLQPCARIHAFPVGESSRRGWLRKTGHFDCFPPAFRPPPRRAPHAGPSSLGGAGGATIGTQIASRHA